MLVAPLLRLTGLADPPGTAEAVARTAPALAEHRHLLLSTERRDGRWVPTPVWFAPDGDRLVLSTAGEAGKVKRIRRTGAARIAPCDVRGRRLGPPDRPADAWLLGGEDAARAARLLVARYGLLQRGVDLAYVVRGLGRPDRAFVAVRPRPAERDHAAAPADGPAGPGTAAEPAAG